MKLVLSCAGGADAEERPGKTTVAHVCDRPYSVTCFPLPPKGKFAPRRRLASTSALSLPFPVHAPSSGSSPRESPDPNLSRVGRSTTPNHAPPLFLLPINRPIRPPVLPVMLSVVLCLSTPVCPRPRTCPLSSSQVSPETRPPSFGTRWKAPSIGCPR
ncbi:hypothetical protein BD414DRAFT_141130 [Trametes punicea]|nr:hypothetical protein BD414DRAFT_141130 [Trametes punicea]